MPTLILLRHAKTETDAVDDWHRQLTDRGREQARSIGPRVATVVGADDCTVLVSTALRAAQTWEEVVPALKPGAVVRELPSLYTSDEDDIVRELREQAIETPTTVVIGHNPGISRLVYLLSGTELPNDDAVAKHGTLRTCRGAVLWFEGAWADLTAGACTLKSTLAPDVD